MNPENSSGIYQSTKWQIFKNKIFPCRYPDYPKLASGNKPGDVIWIKISGHLSCLDRLRLIVSGNVNINVVTATEKSVGETNSLSAISVALPGFMQK